LAHSNRVKSSRTDAEAVVDLLLDPSKQFTGVLFSSNRAKTRALGEQFGSRRMNYWAERFPCSARTKPENELDQKSQ
jgi:hypothetical protein